MYILASLVSGMSQVTKLVLLHTIPIWLNQIATQELLPHLIELQLHTSNEDKQDHGQLILKFVQKMAQQGHAIEVLRLVSDSSDRVGLDTYSAWKERAAEFRKIVKHVSFEDKDPGPQRWLDKRPVAWIELPERYTSGREHIHDFWKQWDIY